MTTLSHIWNTITDRKYFRYYGAVVVFAMMMLLLFHDGEDAVAEADPMAGAYATYKETKGNDELTTLINNYYNAYASGNTEALQELATPISESELSYIGFFSQYVEEYRNLNVQYKRGLDTTSYLVSVVLDMKLTDIDTLAPGLDFFYVQTDENGKLYINNLYGSYNRENAEYETDPAIAELIKAFEAQEDMSKLAAETQEKYNEALAQDPALSEFVSTTFPQAAVAWATGYQQTVVDAKAQEEAEAAAAAEAQAQAEAEAKAAEEAAAAAEAEKAAEEEAQAKAEEEKAQAQADAENAESVFPTAKVNVRKEADGESEQIGQVDSGSEIKKLGEEGDWTKIYYEDGVGYVKSEYLTKEDDTISPGAEITMTGGVYVRAEMNESAEQVDKVRAGESVIVEQSYACGWSKVNFNGQRGFMKTEFLE